MRALLAVVALAACSHAPRIVAVPTLVVEATHAGVADDGASRLFLSYGGVVEVANRKLELVKAALAAACEQNLFVKDCHP